MSGSGIEATVNLNILDKEDFGWNSQINYTFENIDELAPGLESCSLQDLVLQYLPYCRKPIRCHLRWSIFALQRVVQVMMV